MFINFSKKKLSKFREITETPSDKMKKITFIPGSLGYAQFQTNISIIEPLVLKKIINDIPILEVCLLN